MTPLDQLNKDYRKGVEIHVLTQSYEHYLDGITNKLSHIVMHRRKAHFVSLTPPIPDYSNYRLEDYFDPEIDYTITHLIRQTRVIPFPEDYFGGC